MKNDKNSLQELIALNFELEETKTFDETELEQLLSNRIAYMLDHQLDFLLSLLYRLDVEEQKINMALSPINKIPPALALARLVIERQKQRIATKEKYGNADSDPWGDL